MGALSAFGGSGLLGLGGLIPESEALAALADQAHDFITGPAVPDRAPVQVSPRVWMIESPDGFPTPENRGLMANIVFAIGPTGVVVLDSGCSLQIGEMALRVIRTLTDKPVVAVFNSHYHGDHWLGNHAFAKAHAQARTRLHAQPHAQVSAPPRPDRPEELPIYALPHTQQMIRGTEGTLWKSLMERWTHQSTAGTEIVAPNRTVTPGQTLQLAGLTLRMHHHGRAHTPSDLCVQVVEEGVTQVGDIAMGNRIANMDDGSYPGTLAYYDRLREATGAPQIWVPGHGAASRDLLDAYGTFLRGIWDNCLLAVQNEESEAKAKARVLADPRVASRAATMQGFAGNIGKYVSLAYLEAERVAF